jgi:hypothetical protein
MAVSENDLELLDSYLDDALDAAEGDALRARLAADEELRTALEQLRAERSARRALFAALEPGDATVDALVARVREDVRRQQARPAVWSRPWRYGAAAAACVAVGFFSRGLFDRQGGGNLAGDTAGPGVDVRRVEVFVVTLRDESGRVVGQQRFDSHEKAQEFAADLDRWQSRNERLASGRFVVNADRF